MFTGEEPTAIVEACHRLWNQREEAGAITDVSQQEVQDGATEIFADGSYGVEIGAMEPSRPLNFVSQLNRAIKPTGASR